MKIAKLVRVSLVTRVVVDLNATETEIMEAAVPKLSVSLFDDPWSHLEEIADDVEYPYINYMDDSNGNDKELVETFNDIAQGFTRDDLLYNILKYHCSNSNLADITQLLIERKGNQ